jgi:hypothetical protein
MANYDAFPRIGQGFWANVKTNDRHLRLFSAVTEIGEVGCVFDMQAKAWIAREWADDLEDGKRKAETVAKGVLKELPPIEWKKSP